MHLSFQLHEGYQHAKRLQSRSPRRHQAPPSPPRSRTPRPPPPPATPDTPHGQGRPLQRVRVPRHLADAGEARAAGRPRLRARERLLRRHLGHQHQLARGLRRRYTRVEPRVGHLRRLQGRASPRTSPTTWATCATSTRARPTPASPRPTPTRSTSGLGWKFLSAKLSYTFERRLRRRPGRRHGRTWYLDLASPTRSATPARASSRTTGILTSRTTAAALDVSYDDWQARRRLRLRRRA